MRTPVMPLRFEPLTENLIELGTVAVLTELAVSRFVVAAALPEAAGTTFPGVMAAEKYSGAKVVVVGVDPPDEHAARAAIENPASTIRMSNLLTATSFIVIRGSVARTASFNLQTEAPELE